MEASQQLDMALQALGTLFELHRLSILIFGVLLGLAIGVMPGLGGVVALAVLIPFTYNMDAPSAFALLLGVAAVTTISDLIPAVLFGVPGTVGAAATILDGHAMAERGEAGRAFGAGFVAAALGGIFGAIVLGLSIPLLQPVMLAIGSPELLAFSIFGLSMVATLSGRAPLKGLTAAGLGLMISMVGAGTQTGTLRWTFDWLYLFDGVPLIPVTLGLFALPELADLAINRRKITANRTADVSVASQWEGVKDVFRHWWLCLRCSVMGTILGAIPGIGSAVIDWIVYGYAKRTEKGADETFGHGDVRGVIAPESANNAKEGGHLLPTIAFGVPAGASMTLLLGAFLLHGLTPGPDMLGRNLDVTYSIVWSLTLANVIGGTICVFGARYLAKVAELRHEILLPLVMPIVFIATFQATRSWGDLYFLLAFGVIGWIMKQLGWPRPPMVLGYVIGEIFERYLFLSNEIYGTSWLLRPIVLVVGLIIAWALYKPLSETTKMLWHEFKDIHHAHMRVGPKAWFTLFGIAVTIAALITSADWPADEALVPRTACWIALIGGTLNLISEIFGADRAAPAPGAEHGAPKQAALPVNVMLSRAGEYFGWMAGFILLAALIGFIPAIGIFVVLYMALGFRQAMTRSALSGAAVAVLEFFGWLLGFIILASLIGFILEFFGELTGNIFMISVARLMGFILAMAILVALYVGLRFRDRAGAFGVCVTVFCYLVFDRGLSVPWPQSVLGDIFPMLRDSTGLL